MIHLKNDKLQIKISEKGAELQSIQLNNLEYMWQADAAYWSKHSPVLFPVVGELRDGEYFFENKKYKLLRHGFVREKMFEAAQTSFATAVFTFLANEETLAIYPFRFVFKVTYEIKDAGVFCTYDVQNSGDKIMYFSVGGHPAFNVPLKKDLQYTDYFLKFNKDETLHRFLLHKGLTGNETEEIKLSNQTLQLHPTLFYTDAIVLKHISSNEIKLYSDKDAHGLTFKFSGFPYFGIWAAVDAPFVCLEPWCGIADSIHHDHQLIHKEGINKLNAGESWQRSWSIELF